ncbi:MAG: hypothetical protein IH987_10780 [Planctomycetes bacterium]|nr:hypothetical protein [Planctomycetota bacterium]
MLRCEDCEFFSRAPDGSPILACDPFSTVKEPECLAKWQIVQLMSISQSHQATAELHRRLAPFQEKIIKHMEREMDEADDADRWKQSDEDDEDDDRFRL